MTIAPPITLRELDERVSSGLRVRLLWTPVSPSQVMVEVYEGLDTNQPVLTFPVAAQDASEAFLHPYAYAP